MKKTLAITTAILLLGSMVLAQDTGGDKARKTTTATKSTKTSAASTAKSTKPADKVALNPQPLPPGAKQPSTSPESKVALNPQPLPPGAKVQPAVQKKTAAKSKKGSAGTSTGSSTPK